MRFSGAVRTQGRRIPLNEKLQVPSNHWVVDSCGHITCQPKACSMWLFFFLWRVACVAILFYRFLANLYPTMNGTKRMFSQSCDMWRRAPVAFQLFMAHLGVLKVLKPMSAELEMLLRPITSSSSAQRIDNKQNPPGYSAIALFQLLRWLWFGYMMIIPPGCP